MTNKVFEDPSGVRIMWLAAAAIFMALVSLVYALVVNYGLSNCIEKAYAAITIIYYYVSAFGLFYGALYLVLALVSQRRQKRKVFWGSAPAVSVIIPAYNESRVIVKTVQALIESEYPGFLEIIVIDDGSTDDTASVVDAHFHSRQNFKLIRQENRGKAAALNAGIIAAEGQVIVAIDADTLLRADAVAMLARHFSEADIGAVSGNMMVGNPINMLTRAQRLEYLFANNLDRRALELLNGITVVPGAIGAFRKDDLVRLNGFSSETLAEDSDLTIRLLIAGKRVVYEPYAIALTEVPETLTDLKKQRFRWSFGKFQALWKYRSVMFNPNYGVLGLFCLPTQLIGQLVLPCISWISTLLPVYLLICWAYLSFSAGEIVALSAHQCTILWIFLAVTVLAEASKIAAIALEKRASFRILLDFVAPMQIAFRIMMIYLTVVSIFSALSGRVVGWNKLQRKASVSELLAMSEIYASPEYVISKKSMEALQE